MTDTNLTEVRPAAPSVEKMVAEKTAVDSSTRVSRERADAAEYVENLFETTRKALTTVGIVYGPIFNIDATKNDALYSGLKRFEDEMETFRKLILGKSASNKV